MESIVITSENLITNRKTRDMIGYANLADSCKETLAIIEHGLKEKDTSNNSIVQVNIQTLFGIFSNYLSFSNRKKNIVA